MLIIGLFYGSGFDGLYLGLMAVMWGVMLLLPRLFLARHRGIELAYFLLFVMVWLLSLNSGLSPSLAAVVSAFCVTLQPARPGEAGVLKTLLHTLHPFVAYIILPVFAFTAAGVSLGEAGSGVVSDPIFVGIVAGLFVGKPLGVYGAAWLAIRVGWARLPEGANHKGLMAIAILCGIGFTMSLFIGALAFESHAQKAHMAVKLGVIAGSLLAAFAGAIWLRRLR